MKSFTFLVASIRSCSKAVAAISRSACVRTSPLCLSSPRSTPARLAVLSATGNTRQRSSMNLSAISYFTPCFCDLFVQVFRLQTVCNYLRLLFRIHYQFWKTRFGDRYLLHATLKFFDDAWAGRDTDFKAGSAEYRGIFRRRDSACRRRVGWIVDFQKWIALFSDAV